MKQNILNAPFMVETVRILSNMYRLGWDERNGGNLSYLLKEEEILPYVDPAKVKRNIPIAFDATTLVGRYFLVTGTGKYFKNVEFDPENNLGLFKIAKDGKSVDLIWGYRDGGRFTSELPAHLMSHIARLAVDPEHRIVMHTHPTNTIAMSLVLPVNEREFTRALWKMQTESIVVFPEGVAVLPWMVCGNNEIGEATAKEMHDKRLCVWTAHGIYGTGKNIDEAFGLIETVEKAAQLYMLTLGANRPNEIKDEELKDLAKAFNLNYRKDFLD